MSTKTKIHRINLAAPTREEQTLLAAMPESERRALIEVEILKGFQGTPSKVTAQDIKARLQEARLV